MTRTRRRQERDWPTIPVPFFSFRYVYERLARVEWDDPTVGRLPTFRIGSKDLILSALGHPFASVFGQEIYPTVPAKAAALFRGLVKNHGLKDGNKRLAVTVMSMFLLTNGWLPRYTNTQLYRYALRVARHKGAYPVAAIERWIRRHSELATDADLARLRTQNRQIRDDMGDIMEFALWPELMPTASEAEVAAAIEAELAKERADPN